MTILTIGNMYPPHAFGGYEVMWQSWVEHARADGHEVRVLTTDFELSGAETPVDGERDVWRTLRWYWRDHEFPRLSLRERWSIESHNRRILSQALADQAPDVVVWWAMGGMSLSMIERVKRLGIPATAVLADYWLQYGPDVDAWSRAFAGRALAARLVERLTGLITRVELDRGLSYVFVSETVRSRALGTFPDLAKTEVAYHEPDLGLFRAAPAKRWSWDLLVLGRIDARKGLDLAIRALSHLPEQATLEVVGSGDATHLASLRDLACSEGVSDRVAFRGQRPRAELPGVLAAADVLVFPVTWAEPWGLVPCEAMAVGTPVIASGRGGSGEYLRDHENSLIFDPGHGPEQLAERIRTLAEDPTLRARLREGGLETAAELGAENFDERVQAAVERAALAGAG